MASEAHLFSHEGQAKAYGQFRPRYSKELFDTVFAYAGAPQLDIALDIGTGSGQAAVELAKRYNSVIAQDPSAEQLLAAQPQGGNIRYEVARAEATGQLDNSVDLITVAQALHWFDIPAFYTEAARVLRPGGTLAVWGYSLNTFVGEPQATAALQRLFSDDLGQYWDPKRKLVENKYVGVEPPPPLFMDVERLEFGMRKTITVGQFMGYLSSWSAYNSWRAAKVLGPDPLMAFHTNLKTALNFHSHNKECKIEFPMFLLLARKAL